MAIPPVTQVAYGTPFDETTDHGFDKPLADNVQLALEHLRDHTIYDSRTQATTSSGTLTLTNLDMNLQFLTGTATGYTVTMPDATTLSLSAYYTIANTSNQTVNINDGAGGFLLTLSANTVGHLLLRLNGTAAGAWVFWQDSNQAPGQSNSSTPQWKDDFLSYVPSDGAIGELRWQALTNGGAGLVTANTLSGTADSGHPGQVKLGTGGTATGYGFLNLSTAGIVLGGGALSQTWIVFVQTLGVTAQQYSYRMGLGDTPGAEPANGVYFSYAQGVTGNFWAIKTANASTRTSVTTTAAVTASTWYRLRIEINAAATSVTYYVNDVSVGTITTNIPTLAVGPFIGTIKSAGTTAINTWADYFSMDIQLTSTR